MNDNLPPGVEPYMIPGNEPEEEVTVLIGQSWYALEYKASGSMYMWFKAFGAEDAMRIATEKFPDWQKDSSLWIKVYPKEA